MKVRMNTDVLRKSLMAPEAALDSMNNDIQSAARRLIAPVKVLRQRGQALEAGCDGQLQIMAPDNGNSARNMLHYLAVRRSDIHELQDELAALGLNPFAQSEAATMATLNALLVALHCLTGEELPARVLSDPPIDAQTGRNQLAMRSRHCFGVPSDRRDTRIMVTAPAEAAADPAVIRDLYNAGMDVLRIDCTQDGPAAWQAMIRHCRQVESELGRTCKILVDLAGSKPRTGTIESAGRVAKFQPKRDLRGRVVQQARLRFVAAGRHENGTAAGDIPLPSALWEQIRSKDELKFKDTRGRNRTLVIHEQEEGAWLAHSEETCYVETGTPMRLVRRGQRIARGVVGHLPEVVLPLAVNTGDLLMLVHANQPGRPARHDSHGNAVELARIPCTLDAVFDALRPGERVWLDDGRIGAIVTARDAGGVLLRVTQTAVAGARLRADKVINLPDSTLDIPALTAQDLEHLRTLAPYVDMIGLSSVRSADDVEQLQRELHRLGVVDVGIVIKVDTRWAFENLPRLLLAGLQWPFVSIMLGRNDLAVELGVEQLVAAQDEIGTLCAAAHVPLVCEAFLNESPAKGGPPARADLFDMVVSGRAGCVMLNRTPNLGRTVRLLDEMLARAVAQQTQRQAAMQPFPLTPVRVVV